MQFFLRLTRILGGQRNLIIKYWIDLILWVGVAIPAFIIRLELLAITYTHFLLLYLIASLPIKAFLIYQRRLHRQAWHRIGIRDLNQLLRVIGLSTVVIFVLVLLVNPINGMPRSIPIIDGILSIIILSGIRLTVRLYHENEMGNSFPGVAKRVLIVGAGQSGTMIAREMSRHPESALNPVAFLDDEKSKHRESMLGLPVAGTISDLPDVVKDFQIDEILIAMPSAPGQVIREVVALARKSGVKHRTIPAMVDILSGKISINQIREVAVEDLLRRDIVRLDIEEIAQYLKARTVLITGAGGSIGSELVRQIIHFNPKHLVLLDRNETSLYLLERELERDYSAISFSTCVADIQRIGKLEGIFEQYLPDVVFHAAAHKHVPMMEQNPDEAILNNVCGTQNVLDTALKFEIKRFVNISTDKAVRPTSVMGASKRVAEYLVEQASEKAGNGQSYVSVRFGNVLGSSGSVIPIFKEQIKKGGPITITHPEMHRYFMSIPEATQLVLQAGGMNQNGAIYILDMGEPVKIIDVARDLIQLSGLEPDLDISIETVGIRPGEKLYEEILTAEEGTIASRHEKIYTVKTSGKDITYLEKHLEDLISSAHICDSSGIREVLKLMIPTYSPHPLHEHIPL